MTITKSIVAKLTEIGLYQKFEDFCYSIDLIDNHNVRYYLT